MRWDLRWCLKLYREEQFLMEVGIEFHVTGELYIPQNNKTVRIRMQLGHWSFCVCVCSISSHRHTHDTLENNAEEKLKNVQISSFKRLSKNNQTHCKKLSLIAYSTNTDLNIISLVELSRGGSGGWTWRQSHLSCCNCSTQVTATITASIPSHGNLENISNWAPAADEIHCNTEITFSFSTYTPTIYKHWPKQLRQMKPDNADRGLLPAVKSDRNAVISNALQVCLNITHDFLLNYEENSNIWSISRFS